jgi:hypothetical protein
MTATILYKGRPARVCGAEGDGDDLWISPEDLRAATGWELKPDGVCEGDTCIPIPADFLRDDGRFNLAALARLLAEPLVRDPDHGVWSFGESASARRQALSTLQAPDFTLPDLDGRLHSLADCRARKVFLVTWASW